MKIFDFSFNKLKYIVEYEKFFGRNMATVKQINGENILSIIDNYESLTITSLISTNILINDQSEFFLQHIWILIFHTRRMLKLKR